MGNRWRVFFFCEFAKKNQDRELLATFSSKKIWVLLLQYSRLYLSISVQLWTN
jgi:hypothetical protein